MRRTFLALVVLASTAAGCKSTEPDWRLVSQASPNPMTRATVFHVDSVTFEGAMIDGAPVDSLANLPPPERADWVYNLGQLQKTFAGTFLVNRGNLVLSQGAVGPTDLVVRTQIQRITTAKLAADADAQTTVGAHVQIANASGAVLDDIVIEKVIPAVGAPEAAELRERRPERLRKAGAALGVIAATYVRERAGAI